MRLRTLPRWYGWLSLALALLLLILPIGWAGFIFGFPLWLLLTSLLLYLRPDLVLPLDEAGEGRERKSVIRGIREGWAWAERQWSMVTDDTGIGNPKAATKEKGERYFKAVTEKIAGLMAEIAAMDPGRRYG